MNKAELNLTTELAKLLTFVSDVATAIRMNSPYNGQYNPTDKEHGYAVLWLSDCLHNYGMLSDAIQKQDREQILFSCDTLISIYETYKSKDTSKVVFEKHSRGLFTLDNGIEIFNAIKSKVV